MTEEETKGRKKQKWKENKMMKQKNREGEDKVIGNEKVLGKKMKENEEDE